MKAMLAVLLTMNYEEITNRLEFKVLLHIVCQDRGIDLKKVLDVMRDYEAEVYSALAIVETELDLGEPLPKGLGDIDPQFVSGKSMVFN